MSFSHEPTGGEFMCLYMQQQHHISWRLKLPRRSWLLALSLSTSNLVLSPPPAAGVTRFCYVRVPVVFHEKFKSEVASVCSDYYALWENSGTCSWMNMRGYEVLQKTGLHYIRLYQGYAKLLWDVHKSFHHLNLIWISFLMDSAQTLISLRETSMKQCISTLGEQF